MAGRRTGRGKVRKGDAAKLVAAVALMAVALTAAGIGLYVWATATRPPERDQRTFCPTDGPKAVTVVLLDTSDIIRGPTKLDVIGLLTDIVDELPEDALLDLRVLDPAYPAGRPVFAMCNPGDGKGLSEFTRNPALAKRRWRERFREPLDQALNSSLESPESKTSPILATLQGIALDRFAGRAAVKIPKTLVVVSDLIEHDGKEYTQYPPANLSYERFKATPFYHKVRTDLSGAVVRFLYVRRLKPPMDWRAHLLFWGNWVQDNHGQPAPVVQLQGAGQR